MPVKLLPKTTPIVKRLLDIVLTLLLLIFLSPVLLIISIFVACQHGFPILFRQQRPGLFGEIFTIYKFRTMRNAFDQQGKPLPDEKRLTKLGRFLRSTSLDELPICRFTVSSNLAGTMFYQASPVGHRCTGETPFPGRKNFSWMCGMLITGPSGWIFRSLV